MLFIYKHPSGHVVSHSSSPCGTSQAPKHVARHGYLDEAAALTKNMSNRLAYIKQNIGWLPLLQPAPSPTHPRSPHIPGLSVVDQCDLARWMFAFFLGLCMVTVEFARFFRFRDYLDYVHIDIPCSDLMFFPVASI